MNQNLKIFGAGAVNCTNLIKAERHVSEMLLHAEKAHRSGKQKRFRYFAAEYLNSYDARLMAVREAYRALNWGRRPEINALPGIAKSLDAWIGADEPMRVNIEPKDSGDYRIVMDFGIINRALQYLVFPLVGASADLHDHQYGTLGGGTHAAISYVRDMLMEGCVYAVEIDVANCFGSFDEKKVPGLLSIPKEVTQRTVISRYLNLVPGNLRDCFGPADEDGQESILLVDTLAEARLGVPQGSALSSLIAEVLLAIPLKTLPIFGRVAGYADNILVMSNSETDGVAMSQALCSALKAHPAGPLRPKVRDFFGRPIDFLGHRLTVIGGQVKIEPIPDNETQFQHGLASAFSCLNRTDISKERRTRKARELATYVRSWTAAFKLCVGMSERRQHLLVQIAQAQTSQCS
jgi:hypothetical protein